MIAEGGVTRAQGVGTPHRRVPAVARRLLRGPDPGPGLVKVILNATAPIVEKEARIGNLWILIFLLIYPSEGMMTDLILLEYLI